MVTTIEIDGIELNVVNGFEGKYYPATSETPAEYPELVIGEIYVTDSNINIYNLLSEEQIDTIFDKLYEIRNEE